MTMKLSIERVFHIDCAHSLAGFVAPDHKCARRHGHTYTVTVALSTDHAVDWIVDFGVIKDAIMGPLDHRDLNEVFAQLFDGAPTTVENLTSLVWILVEAALQKTVNKDGIIARIDRIEVREGFGGSARLEARA